VVAFVALLIVACGDDDGAASGTTTSTTPATTGSTLDGTEAPDEDDGGGTDDGGDEGGGDGSPPAEGGSLEVVAEGLEAPWDVAFTPDGRTFVSERDSGRLVEIASDGSVDDVRTFDDVDPESEGGLLGLAVSPDHADDGWLYAYYTTPDDNRIVRFTLDGDEEELVTGIPSSPIHNGGVIEFGPDGMLYAGTGDAGSADRAQDDSSLAGKILRLEPDGSVPDDNPAEGSLVWTSGHRNVQGLAWSADGTLYATELGPDRDDEVNRIEAGQNYGWPIVTGQTGDDRFTDPIAVFSTDEASPSGAVVVDGGAWDGDMVFAALRGQRLWRLTFEQGEVTGREAHLAGEFGRLRNVVQHPDGPLWILTSNRDGRGSPVDTDDRILELTPPPP
jgi:glucose/arabinose dehydrogenase